MAVPPMECPTIRDGAVYCASKKRAAPRISDRVEVNVPFRSGLSFSSNPVKSMCKTPKPSNVSCRDMCVAARVFSAHTKQWEKIANFSGGAPGGSSNRPCTVAPSPFSKDTVFVPILFAVDCLSKVIQRNGKW